MSLADQHAALLAQLHSSRPAGLSVSPSRMHGSASGGPSYMGATHSSRARTTTLSAALGPASPTPSFAGSAARSPGRDFIAVPEGGSFQLARADASSFENFESRVTFELKEQVRRLKTELEEVTMRMGTELRRKAEVEVASTSLESDFVDLRAKYEGEMRARLSLEESARRSDSTSAELSRQLEEEVRQRQHFQAEAESSGRRAMVSEQQLHAAQGDNEALSARLSLLEGVIETEFAESRSQLGDKLWRLDEVLAPEVARMAPPQPPPPQPSRHPYAAAPYQGGQAAYAAGGQHGQQYEQHPVLDRSWSSTPSGRGGGVGGQPPVSSSGVPVSHFQSSSSVPAYGQPAAATGMPTSPAMAAMAASHHSSRQSQPQHWH